MDTTILGLAATALLATSRKTPSPASMDNNSPPSRQQTAVLAAAAANRAPLYDEVDRNDCTIFKICLTGGPCAGKSTALAELIRVFESQGVAVLCVPEAATLLINGGVTFVGASADQCREYQIALLRLQLQLEHSFVQAAIARAGAGGKALVVCDRGALDARAYCDNEQWRDICSAAGCTTEDLRDRQYDGIYHLVTAADGAEAFYTTANNSARSETPEQARALDSKLRDAYVGHRVLVVVTNDGDFKSKLGRLTEAVSHLMGLTGGRTKKFMVTNLPDEIPVPHVKFELAITFLGEATNGVEWRICRRGQRAFAIQRVEYKDDQRIITERRVSSKECADVMNRHEERCRRVVKMNHAFMWNSRHYEVGRVIEPAAHAGKTVLYVHGVTTADSKTPDVPPWLQVGPEVTDDPQWASKMFAE
eukprot:NODE_1294_length_1391_cov_55.231013_g1283_i0.p1 GENE.NODE_1294_length_1391_cov_55.231013_g1283_i0~~NODE_1294_length_1391_cov_55.231013_g1283_i0.p1  ORF type:complete len:421 (+),score=70.15 NODE_1294_length_1391_cov_55.231013_g1283_i0:55-1317(+)